MVTGACVTTRSHQGFQGSSVSTVSPRADDRPATIPITGARNHALCLTKRYAPKHSARELNAARAMSVPRKATAARYPVASLVAGIPCQSVSEDRAELFQDQCQIDGIAALRRKFRQD